MTIIDRSYTPFPLHRTRHQTLLNFNFHRTRHLTFLKKSNINNTQQQRLFYGRHTRYQINTYYNGIVNIYCIDDDRYGWY